MSLLSPVITPTPSPAQSAAAQIRQKVQASWAAMIDGQVGIFNLVWHAPDASPQEVLNELGPDAAQLFQLGAANVATILNIDQNAIKEADWKPPYVVTINQDGTVTVTTTPTP